MAAKPALVRVKRRRNDPAPENLGTQIFLLLPSVTVFPFVTLRVLLPCWAEQKLWVSQCWSLWRDQQLKLLILPSLWQLWHSQPQQAKSAGSSL